MSAAVLGAGHGRRAALLQPLRELEEVGASEGVWVDAAIESAVGAGYLEPSPEADAYVGAFLAAALEVARARIAARRGHG